MNDLEEFRAVWKKFMTRLKGAVIQLSEEQRISYSNINIIFDEVASDWSLPYDECGRWLADYEKKEPDKGAVERKILTEDMKLTEEEEAKDFPSAAKYAVPATGAAGGFLVSSLLGAPFWLKAVSAAVPALLLYPVVSAKEASENAANQDQLINSYFGQLKKYRRSVESVIDE